MNESVEALLHVAGAAVFLDRVRHAPVGRALEMLYCRHCGGEGAIGLGGWHPCPVECQGLRKKIMGLRSDDLASLRTDYVLGHI